MNKLVTLSYTLDGNKNYSVQYQTLKPIASSILNLWASYGARLSNIKIS